MTVPFDSDELKQFKKFMDALCLPYRITETWSDPALEKHTATSYHYKQGTNGKGRGADVAGSTPNNKPEMNAIFEAVLPFASTFKELLYNGAKSAIYHFPGHDNHIHFGLPIGWKNPIPVTVGELVPDNPDVPNIADIKFFEIVVKDGVCTGYYVVSSTGEVHGHGPGAPYYGRSEDVTP